MLHVRDYERTITLDQFSARNGHSKIAMEISPIDDMYVANNPEHYWSVGRSAISIISNAMLLAGKDSADTVLDLPCGGGRVTRHLPVLFPKSKLFVGDLDKAKEQFAAHLVNAKTVEPGPSFDKPSPYKFDLIFVGSLLTHFSAQMCQLAMAWFIDALQQNGLLVVTLNGRRALSQNQKHWELLLEQYRAKGFVFRPDDPLRENDPTAYGGSLSLPSWVMRLVEGDHSVRIISYQEAAWDNHQDAITIQKRSINE